MNRIWAELVSHRELLEFLVWKDLKVRYKETTLGVVWVVLQPILAMLTFTLFLGRWAPSDGTPYAAFVLTGLVPWFFFSDAIRQCSNCIIGNGHLIHKVYFPRIIFPVSCFISELVDLAIGILLLVVSLPFIGGTFHGHLSYLFTSFFLLFSASLGTGLWLAALNARFRDVGYILPFLTQLWFFSTPIVYSSAALSPGMKAIYSLNPLVGAIDCFRVVTLGANAPNPTTLVAAFGSATILLVTGLYFFQMSEKHFPDRI